MSLAVPELLVPALERQLARITHDLGKYIVLQSRWASEPSELLVALRDDLLATRRSPQGTEDAVSLWRCLRAPLVGEESLEGHRFDLSDDPDVVAVDELMGEIEVWIPALSTRSLGLVELQEIARLAAEVSRRCRALHRRALEQLHDG